jgi:Methylamine utilisation protein MauE
VAGPASLAWLIRRGDFGADAREFGAEPCAENRMHGSTGGGWNGTRRSVNRCHGASPRPNQPRRICPVFLTRSTVIATLSDTHDLAPGHASGMGGVHGCRRCGRRPLRVVVDDGCGKAGGAPQAVLFLSQVTSFRSAGLTRIVRVVSAIELLTAIGLSLPPAREVGAVVSAGLAVGFAVLLVYAKGVNA